MHLLKGYDSSSGTTLKNIKLDMQSRNFGYFVLQYNLNLITYIQVMCFDRSLITVKIVRLVNALT